MARIRAQDYVAKRKIILHRAAELFAKYGFNGSSITMIANACGASKALLYHYYKDKEEVLFDILSDHLDELIEAVEEAADRPAPPHDRLYNIAAALLEKYRDADAQHQVQIANLKLLEVDRQELLRGKERRLVAVFSDALAEAVPEVGQGPLLKPLTMTLFGMLNWHYLWFREGKGISRNDYARMVSALIVAGAPSAVEALAQSVRPTENTALIAAEASKVVEESPSKKASRKRERA